MKKLTRLLLWTYGLGLFAGLFSGGLAYYASASLELAILIGIVVFYVFADDSISTYFALRRKPEYQKDVKNKD